MGGGTPLQPLPVWPPLLLLLALFLRLGGIIIIIVAATEVAAVAGLPLYSYLFDTGGVMISSLLSSYAIIGYAAVAYCAELVGRVTDTPNPRYEPAELVAGVLVEHSEAESSVERDIDAPVTAECGELLDHVGERMSCAAGVMSPEVIFCRYGAIE